MLYDLYETNARAQYITGNKKVTYEFATTNLADPSYRLNNFSNQNAKLVYCDYFIFSDV